MTCRCYEAPGLSACPAQHPEDWVFQQQHREVYGFSPGAGPEITTGCPHDGLALAKRWQEMRDETRRLIPEVGLRAALGRAPDDPGL